MDTDNLRRLEGVANSRVNELEWLPVEKCWLVPTDLTEFKGCMTAR